MARNLELDRIKEAEKTAFAKKQEAWEKYAKAREEASAAHDRMQKAWQERDSAREMMNREYEEMQSSSSRYREIWDEYGVVRDACNARIESLRNEAELEHREMQNCFDRASNQYQYGDKSMAPVYSQEGRRHKERRDELNARVSELCREVKEARQNAEWRAPKTDNSAFKNAQTRFKEAKLCHKQLEAEFKQLKTVRDQLKLEFNEAQNKHKQLKAEFEEKLAGLKKQQKNEREEILDKAGISWMEREDAKIVKKADGTTQVYSGGLGEGDGLGHGHVALDNDGKKTYERKAFAEHGEQNYISVNDSSLSVYPSIGQWTELRHGWIKGHEVTWCEGTGINSGQVLICDGHVDRDFFDSHHDHYGPDVKYGSGRRIEDITDSMGRKKYYSGPGK